MFHGKQQRFNLCPTLGDKVPVYPMNKNVHLLSLPHLFSVFPISRSLNSWVFFRLDVFPKNPYWTCIFLSSFAWFMHYSMFCLLIWIVNLFRALNDVTVNNKDQYIYSSHYLIDIIHFIILYIKEWLSQVTYNQKFAKICHWSYSRRIQEQEVNSVLEQEEKSILMTQKLSMEQSILRTGFLSWPRTYFIK